MAFAISSDTELATQNDRAVATQPNSSKAKIWMGRALSGLATLFFLFDGIMKLIKPAIVVKSTVELGFPESSIVGLGTVLLASTALYVVPRTSMLGAILLTGYLGGAVCAQVRVGAVPFNIIFPVLFGAIVWGGLCLRNERVRRALLGTNQL